MVAQEVILNPSRSPGTPIMLSTLFFLYILTAVFAFPTSSLTSVSTSRVSSTDNSPWTEIVCFSGLSGIFTTDCERVIAKFPLDPKHAAFSRNARPGWKLPDAKVFSSCLAIIDLDLLPVDYTSWTAIRHQLTSVYKKCVVGGKPGGYAILGDFNGITVSLQQSRAPHLVSPNFNMTVGSIRLDAS